MRENLRSAENVLLGHFAVLTCLRYQLPGAIAFAASGGQTCAAQGVPPTSPRSLSLFFRVSFRLYSHRFLCTVRVLSRRNALLRRNLCRYCHTHLVALLALLTPTLLLSTVLSARSSACKLAIWKLSTNRHCSKHQYYGAMGRRVWPILPGSLVRHGKFFAYHHAPSSALLLLLDALSVDQRSQNCRSYIFVCVQLRKTS